MKFDTLEDLIKHIYYDIMKTDYTRVLNISFDKDSILMFVFENEIPIRINKQRIYSVDNRIGEVQVVAEVYAELLRQNIGQGWLSDLDKICKVIEENGHIFEKLLEGGNKNDKSSI